MTKTAGIENATSAGTAPRPVTDQAPRMQEAPGPSSSHNL
jgi:hypothetical protein